eukprot:scaffold520_cov63-Phaeocystis_antarctica.AAC.2
MSTSNACVGSSSRTCLGRKQPSEPASSPKVGAMSTMRAPWLSRRACNKCVRACVHVHVHVNSNAKTSSVTCADLHACLRTCLPAPRARCLAPAGSRVKWRTPGSHRTWARVGVTVGVGVRVRVGVR